MEEKVIIQAEGLKLEGLLMKGRNAKGVIVTHPHPLYGGDMYNSVVASAIRVGQQSGYTTLRFNFRGVGASQGQHANGFGEQDDVKAAISYITAMGLQAVDLVGYSFGAWVNAHLACQMADIDRMVMISPPVAFMPFSEALALPCLSCVIAGGRDEIGPSDLIASCISQWNTDAQLHVIKRADHFYSGCLDEMEAVLSSHLSGLSAG